MPENSIPLPMPWGGLSEHEAFADQPADTAREFQNTRIQDTRTGRKRISQRSGLSKYCDTGLGASKVSDLTSLFVDNRAVTYSAISAGSETITWDTPTPSMKDCLNLKTDRQGNVYALDGNAGIVKYSADETLLMQIAVPVKDENHVCRALFVDELDRIYVAVSAGGIQADAKIWCYEQLPDNKSQILFEISPKDYVEDVLVAKDQLYTIQNNVERRRSWCRIYDKIDSTTPALVKEFRIPHPANSLAVKTDGSVIIAADETPEVGDYFLREGDPLFPNFNVDSVDWTPYQLERQEHRIWGWWVADDIDAFDVAGDLKEGVEILTWRDRSRNLRHLKADLEAGDNGPVLAMDALIGHKAVRWTKTGTTQPFQVLRSDPNTSIAKEFADQQRTMVPAYTESQFAMYIVCRPSQTVPLGDNTPRIIWGQDRDNAQSGADDHVLFANASDANGASLPPTGNAGGVYWYTGESVSSGDGHVNATDIRSGDFDVKPDTSTENPGNFVIIAMVNDGAITGDTQDSLFQINGNPIALFGGSNSVTLEPSYLGFFRSFGTALSGSSGFLGDIVEIIVLDRRNRMDASSNVLTYDQLQHDSGAASQTVNENTLIVGYLAHKYGAQGNLPFGTPAANNYPHPFGLTGTTPNFESGPPKATGQPSAGVSTAQARANKRWGCVVKYSPEGKIVWTANQQTLTAGTLSGGFGFAVAVNSDGNIYSIGPHTENGSPQGTHTVRMIVDQGTTFSLDTANGAWSVTTVSEYDYHYPKVDVDQFDNFYLPWNETGSVVHSFRVYKKDGTLLNADLFSASQQAYAVACDRRIPDYRTDLTDKRCEHVIVATDNEGSITNATVHKVRLVNATQSGATPRTLTLFGVDAGDIKTFTTAAVSTPTGGSGALDSTATYIQSTTLYKKAYWTDGKNYKRYDPTTGVISNFTSTSAGSIPPRCQLIDTWRGRIVLARSADNPHNWFLSKKDEPNNWDYFPPVPTETDAVAGTFPNGTPSAAGPAPDIINTVVPYSQDILVFGCDHSIWMLVGDPAAGGRMELVSDITGMSFGRPWCKDPNGVLYFFGSKGGVFRWAPGAQIERVSVFKIERSLQDVNLGTHYVRLAYNYRDEGIHILVCPFGAGGTQVSHFFFELKQEAFSKDLFGTTTHTNVQPTAVMVIDGDAFDDRMVLFGCEDGFVRKWDPDAKSDDFRTDGETHIAIDSFVTIGPVQGAAEVSGGLETQFSGLTVILSDQDDGAKFELYATEEADSIGATKRSGMLVAGRNPPKWDKICGPHAWVRLRNAAAEERWSLERAYLYMAPGGLVRPR